MQRVPISLLFIPQTVSPALSILPRGTLYNCRARFNALLLKSLVDIRGRSSCPALSSMTSAKCHAESGFYSCWGHEAVGGLGAGIQQEPIEVFNSCRQWEGAGQAGCRHSARSNGVAVEGGRDLDELRRDASAGFVREFDLDNERRMRN